MHSKTLDELYNQYSLSSLKFGEINDAFLSLLSRCNLKIYSSEKIGLKKSAKP